ncbi:MAG TPA: monooxygenase [Allocoleopsis sp.]
MPFMLLQIDFLDTRPNNPDPTNPENTSKTEALIPLAQSIATTPGLIWKIWTENPETQEAGGIYLFEDEASLEAYLAIHTVRLKGLGIEQINAKKFQVNEPLTEITRGMLKG